MISKLNLSYFSFLILILTITTFAQTDFEGKVVMRISGEDSEESGDIDYFIKDQNLRMEMKSAEESMFILFNNADSKMYMVMPEQKMYMDFAGIDFLGQGNTSDKNDDTEINKTGEYKQVNGYQCEKWIIKDNEETVEAWMTDELGNFLMMTNPMMGTQDAWQTELQGNYFPMKVEIIEDGEKKTAMEVLSVNEMSLNADLFSIPKDFQKLDMPSMDSNK
ncbi:MAG TPA: DUF4412 domain-containing protein [Ignavibacteriaceae bacterium]|nr:DUF4412 domain-containing protein [Ignavibacteriaceae bacterium]